MNKLTGQNELWHDEAVKLLNSYPEASRSLEVWSKVVNDAYVISNFGYLSFYIVLCLPSLAKFTIVIGLPDQSLG